MTANCSLSHSSLEFHCSQSLVHPVNIHNFPMVISIKYMLNGQTYHTLEEPLTYIGQPSFNSTLQEYNSIGSWKAHARG